MLDNPLISIITINYNDKIGLERTLKSVTNQTYQNFEYIVIDGGSTDGSKELIEKYQEKIKYWVSEPDKGIYNAMNKGIINTNGEYLLFINSGDELLDSNVLEENYSVIHTEDLVYFNINVVGEQDNYIKKYPSKISFSYMYQDTLPHPATFIKKKLFDGIGFYDEKLKIVSDWKFFILALVKYNATYKYVDKTLSIFYFDGISSRKENLELLLTERKQVISNEFSLMINDFEKINQRKQLIEEIKMNRIIKLFRKLGFIKIVDKL
jgi:glycosyltransferase involved in cell wall biosynthesis